MARIKSFFFIILVEWNNGDFQQLLNLFFKGFDSFKLNKIYFDIILQKGTRHF